MRVLLAAPTSDKKDYCSDEWIEMVRNLSYPGLDILLIDNSKDEQYHHKFLEAGLLCIHVRPEGNAMDYITECQNVIRDYALQNKYDFLFSLETDVFVPKNIIEYLISYDAPIINVSYFVRTGAETTLCVLGVLKNRAFKRTKLVNPEEAFALFNGQVRMIDEFMVGPDYEMFGNGIGCSLIARDVLEKIKFRVDRKVGLTAFSDSFFHMDAYLMGIPNVLDTSLLVEHKRQDWNSNIDLFK